MIRLIVIFLCLVYTFVTANMSNEFTIYQASCDNLGYWQSNNEEIFNWGYDCTSHKMVIIGHNRNEGFYIINQDSYAGMLVVDAYINKSLTFTLNETYIESEKMEFNLVGNFSNSDNIKGFWKPNNFTFYRNEEQQIAEAIQNNCQWTVYTSTNSSETEKLLVGMIVTLEAFKNQYRGDYPLYNWNCHDTTTTSSVTETTAPPKEHMGKNEYIVPVILAIVCLFVCIIFIFCTKCKERFEGCYYGIWWFTKRCFFKNDHWDYDEL